MFVGCVQIASTTKLWSLLGSALFIVTDHSSGTVPVVSQSENLTLTPVGGAAMSPGVTPPPITTIPCGQTATPVASDWCGSEIGSDSAYVTRTGPGGPCAPAGPAGPAGPVAPAAPANPRGPRAPRGSCPALKSFFISEPLMTWRVPTLFAGSSLVAAAYEVPLSANSSAT